MGVPGGSVWSECTHVDPQCRLFSWAGSWPFQVLDGVTFNSDSLGTLFWGLVNGEVLVGFCFCPNNQPVLPTLLPEKRLSSLLESGPGLLTCQAVFLPPLHPESPVDIFMAQFPSRMRFTGDYVFCSPHTSYHVHDAFLNE